VRGWPLAGGGAWQGWRAIFAGSGEPDAKGLLDLLAKITGLRAPAMKIPHGVALGVAYVESAFSRLWGKSRRFRWKA